MRVSEAGVQDMTFAEKLKAIRIEKGLSERGLADAAGVPYGALHTYAIGTRKPSFAYVVKIARALGVTCEAFSDCTDIAADEEPAPAKKPRKPKK